MNTVETVLKSIDLLEFLTTYSLRVERLLTFPSKRAEKLVQSYITVARLLAASKQTGKPVAGTRHRRSVETVVSDMRSVA